MSVWMKISTLVRGQARVTTERVLDAHALTILEQEIVDGENALRLSRQHLAAVLAEKARLTRERDQHHAQRETRESQARAALAQGDEALAMEVAEAIATLNKRVAHADDQLAKLERHEQGLRTRLQEGAATVADVRRELTLLRAVDSAQKASDMISGHGASLDDRMAAMKGSLDRIRARQQAWEDTDAALRDLNGEAAASSLDDKLKAAGIVAATPDAAAVLARLKQA